MLDDPRLVQSGPKLALARWYSWLDSWHYWQPVYHLRLLILLYWGMGMSVLSKTDHGLSLSQAAAPPGNLGGRRSP